MVTFKSRLAQRGAMVLILTSGFMLGLVMRSPNGGETTFDYTFGILAGVAGITIVEWNARRKAGPSQVSQ